MSALPSYPGVEVLWCGCPLLDVNVPTARDPYRARDLPCGLCGEVVPAYRAAFYVRLPRDRRPRRAHPSYAVDGGRARG